MPFYNYRCTVCGHTFEDLKRVDDPNPPCIAHVGVGDMVEECGGETVKVPSLPGPPKGCPTGKFYGR